MSDRMTFAGGRKSENTRQGKDNCVCVEVPGHPFT
jgi:hypothetical protein